MAAKLGWVELVRDLMPWCLVVNAATFNEREAGMTYSEQRRMCRPEDRIPGRPIRADEAVSRFRAFFDRARHDLGRPVEGFMAMEGDGLWRHIHGHGLVWLGGSQVLAGDIKVLHDSWYRVKGNGTIRFQWGDEMQGDWFLEYTTKHTVKDLSEMYFSPGVGREYYRGL
jgi:hypothetical protein